VNLYRQGHDRHHHAATVDRREGCPARGRASSPVRWRHSRRTIGHRGGAALSGLVALDCDIEFIGWDVCDAARQMLSSFNTASIRTSQADTFS
jgi:hypothetical protein